MLSIGPLVVIAFTVTFSVLTQKISAFRAVLLGTLVSMVAFAVLAVHASITAAYATLVVIAVGELIQQPRYYDYISRLAPAGQQGTYMGFAFFAAGDWIVFGGADRRRVVASRLGRCSTGRNFFFGRLPRSAWAQLCCCGFTTEL